MDRTGAQGANSSSAGTGVMAMRPGKIPDHSKTNDYPPGNVSIQTAKPPAPDTRMKTRHIHGKGNQ